MRLGHARGLACAKTKKFPCIFLAPPPPTPPPRSGKRNGKEIFGFAAAASKFSLPQYAKFRYCNPAYKLLILCQTQYEQRNMAILSENCEKLALKQVCDR